MKKISILILTFFIFAPCYSQTARDYMQTGSDKGTAGDWNGAIADFTKAMELDPDFSYAYYMRGLAETFLEDYVAAISDFTKFIAIDPNDPLGYSSRGNAKYLSQDNEGALADFNKAIELAPDPGDLSSRGDVLRMLNNYEAAISDYSRAIDLLPEDDQKLGHIYYHRGNCKVMIGQMEGCLDLGKSILLGFEGPLYCSVKNAEDYVTEGKLKNENGDYEGAIADFTSAIEINPGEQLVYFWRGTAKFRLGDYNGAIADYSKDIEIGVEPYTSDSYYGRALAKNQLVDYSSAIDDMNMAIEIYETPPYFHEFRGFLKIQAGQNESGCVDLAKAVELGSTTADQLIQEYCK